MLSDADDATVLEPHHEKGQSRDIIEFKDGDVLSGEILRIEDGAVVFRNPKVGQVRVGLEQLKDLKSARPFAVFRQKVKLTPATAIIGQMELKDGKVIITAKSSPARELKYGEMAYAVEDATFEQEYRRKRDFREGWDMEAFGGLSLLRSTQDGVAMNTGGTLMRSIPGVEFLPRRSLTQIAIKDSYEQVETQATKTAAATHATTHTLHAGAIRNEYLPNKIYFLADYTFDRNITSGIMAQHVVGGGIGYLWIETLKQTLDVKTDFHRKSQGFTNPDYNNTVFGERFQVDYERALGRTRLRNSGDYLAAYSDPHKYGANISTQLILPVMWRVNVSLSVTDNYINNALPGYHRNTLRFSTNLLFR